MLVAENDVDGFARTVIELLENREHARALGQAARRRIENELSTEAAVRNVENLYRGMMADNERSR
jgi:glycosyltransferase involved in cell wall biosynthesis